MKLHKKKGDCLALGFVSKLSSAIYPKISEIKLKDKDHMRALDDRETKCLHGEIWRYSSIAFSRS